MVRDGRGGRGSKKSPRAVTLTAAEFKQAQLTLGLTNKGLAAKLYCSERAVEFWRSGERAIPGPVKAAIECLCAKRF